MQKINFSLNYNNISFSSSFRMVKKNVIKNYLEQGLDSVQIANVLKTTPAKVDYMIKTYCLTEEGLAELQRIEKEVMSLREKRATYEQISTLVGISMNAVKNIMQNLNRKDLLINRGRSKTEISTIKNRKPENNHSRSTRSEKRNEKCKIISELYAKGFSQEEIAKKMSYCVSTIKGYLKYINQQKNLD